MTCTQSMEGYLHKQSGGKVGVKSSIGNAISKWDKRWFVLDATKCRLSYYKAEKDAKTGKQARPAIDLLRRNKSFSATSLH